MAELMPAISGRRHEATCLKCGSATIVPDYDHVTHEKYLKCYMCGSLKIHIPDQEVDNMGTSVKEKCAVEGCTSLEVKGGLCHRHYREKYGEAPYRKPKVGPMKAKGAPEGVRLFEVPAFDHDDDDENKIKLDFTGRGEILAEVTRLARKQFRDVDQQILSMLWDHITDKEAERLRKKAEEEWQPNTIKRGAQG